MSKYRVRIEGESGVLAEYAWAVEFSGESLNVALRGAILAIHAECMQAPLLADMVVTCLDCHDGEFNPSLREFYQGACAYLTSREGA